MTRTTPDAPLDVLPPKPPGVSWRDHLCMLLQIGAEIEHALLVQYLYAAYSLGGDQVPKHRRPLVRRWQDVMLTVAREEMGHLISVQNLVTLLGGSVTFRRRDYPFDSEYFPAPFQLEPLSLASMAAFVYAEMPPGLHVPGKREKGGSTPAARAERHVLRYAKRKDWHHVGTIYQQITDIIAAKNPLAIPDSAFDANTYAQQASFEEWGKSYLPQPPDTNANPALDPKLKSPYGRIGVPRCDRSATVVVARAATRQQALAALDQIAAQGESLRPTPVAVDENEPSHFERFLLVYEGLEVAKKEHWKPARNVPVNPTTRTDVGRARTWTVITDPVSRTWADLFNLRYRMALMWMTHIFRLAGDTAGPTRGLRGLTVHRIFGEMYTMKAVAGVLMRSPLTDDPDDDSRAGPPFAMPYTLALPTLDADCWRLHRELLEESVGFCDALVASEKSPESLQFAVTLRATDRQAIAWIDQVLAGLRTGRKGVQA